MSIHLSQMHMIEFVLFILQLLGFTYACYVANTLSHEDDSCESIS